MATSLDQAVAHIQAGELEEGKQILAQVLRQNPRDEKAWLWLALCVTDTEQERYCFDRVLKINPQNQSAIEGLRRLDNPISPPTPPKVKQQEPVREGRPGDVILTLAIVGVGIFLVALFLYAWWIAR
jgi:ferric-dicitrate binding protein FerR (iron transport regulator)